MSNDTIRRITVTVAGLLCAFGTAVGTGLIGTRVEESAGGSLSDEATLIAPAGPAFSIWSVIYLGLAGYVIWQWLPANATDSRARATGWLAAASMVLNAAWLLVTQQGWLWASVAVIVVLALVLKAIAEQLSLHPARGWGDRIVGDGTFGLYLGWVAVATCANIAATLVASGLPATGTGPEIVTVVLLLVVLALGWFYSRRYPNAVRWPVAAAMTWGVAWIAYGRLGEEPSSTTVGLSAAAVAIALAIGAAFMTAVHRVGSSGGSGGSGGSTGTGSNAQSRARTA